MSARRRARAATHLAQRHHLVEHGAVCRDKLDAQLLIGKLNGRRRAVDLFGKQADDDLRLRLVPVNADVETLLVGLGRGRLGGLLRRGQVPVPARAAALDLEELFKLEHLAAAARPSLGALVENGLATVEDAFALVALAKRVLACRPAARRLGRHDRAFRIIELILFGLGWRRGGLLGRDLGRRRRQRLHRRVLLFSVVLTDLASVGELWQRLRFCRMLASAAARDREELFKGQDTLRAARVALLTLVEDGPARVKLACAIDIFRLDERLDNATRTSALRRHCAVHVRPSAPCRIRAGRT